MKGVGAGLASVAAGYSVVSHWIWTIFNGGEGEKKKSLLWIDKSDFMQEGVSWVSINWRVTPRIYRKIKNIFFFFFKKEEKRGREEEETGKKEEEKGERKAVN